MQETAATRTPASHQTVKLSKGRHSSPEDGVCVVELASMLAHEPFSDHPRSVCPVIAAFLRSYNDHLDDCRRQDLYAYAAKVVETRSTGAVERMRAKMCREWTRRGFERRQSRPQQPVGPPPSSVSIPIWERVLRSYRARAGQRAALAVSERELDLARHREVLCFVDDLIAAGERSGPVSAGARMPPGQSRLDGTHSRVRASRREGDEGSRRCEAAVTSSQSAQQTPS